MHSAVTNFIDMRRENVAAMVKSAMPICSPEEVEEIVTHDDGMHVHKLITAVINVSAYYKQCDLGGCLCYATYRTCIDVASCACCTLGSLGGGAPAGVATEGTTLSAVHGHGSLPYTGQPGAGQLDRHVGLWSNFPISLAAVRTSVESLAVCSQCMYKKYVCWAGV